MLIKSLRIVLMMQKCFNAFKAESLRCYKSYTNEEIIIVVLSILNVLEDTEMYFWYETELTLLLTISLLDTNAQNFQKHKFPENFPKA